MSKIIDNSYSMADIQSAINANGEVIFSAGTYNITRALVIPSNRRISLDPGAVLKRKAGCSFFVTDHTAKTKKYNGASNILIDGHGTLYGVDSVGTYCNAISLFHASNVTLRDIILFDIQGSHAVEINASEHVTVDNVKFQGYNSNTEATFREAIQLDFANATGLSLISDVNAACYDLTPCNDITIQNCKFIPSKYHAAPNTAIGTHTRPVSNLKHTNIRVLDNYAEGGAYSGHFMSIMNMDGVIVAGNQVSGYNRFARITALEKGYYSDGTTTTDDDNIEYGISENIDIHDNIIKNPSGKYVCPGILCQGYGSKRHKNINAHHNIFVIPSSNKNANQYINLAYVDGAQVDHNVMADKELIAKTYATTTDNAVIQ